MQTKTPFSGNLEEKAYLLGLRTGDVHARKHYRLIQADTTSPKPSQLVMFRDAFGKYGAVKSYKKKGGYTVSTNRIYCFLDSSFNFLIEKPKIIPKWAIKNNGIFYSFLAGYADSEGSWIITQHTKYNGRWKDLVFSLGTCDKEVLEQIHCKLKELGFNSHFYLVRKKGVYGNRICNYDLYRVMMMNHKDVVRLAEILQPISLHEDKKRKQLEIIDYYQKNEQLKILKRQNLGTLKISCPKCNNSKAWKNGFSKYNDKLYPRYKCAKCKKEFSGEKYAQNRSFA
jgi:predicted Zn-ribbon and HTH transcriptional regulator